MTGYEDMLRWVNVALCFAVAAAAIHQTVQVWRHVSIDVRLKGLSFALIMLSVAFGTIGLLAGWPPIIRIVTVTVAGTWGIISYLPREQLRFTNQDHVPPRP